MNIENCRPRFNYVDNNGKLLLPTHADSYSRGYRDACNALPQLLEQVRAGTLTHNGLCQKLGLSIPDYELKLEDVLVDMGFQLDPELRKALDAPVTGYVDWKENESTR